MTVVFWVPLNPAFWAYKYAICSFALPLGIMVHLYDMVNELIKDYMINELMLIIKYSIIN